MRGTSLCAEAERKLAAREVSQRGGGARRGSESDGYADRISTRSTRLSTPYFASKLETWNLAVREEMWRRLAISLLERFSRRSSRTSVSRRLRLAAAGRSFLFARNVFSMKRDSEVRGTQKPPPARVRRACVS